MTTRQLEAMTTRQLEAMTTRRAGIPEAPRYGCGRRGGLSSATLRIEKEGPR
jgi:hypothetical protein